MSFFIYIEIFKIGIIIKLYILLDMDYEHSMF